MKEIEKLKPFTKFLMTIGELPSSYLISMTYEEQLLWFCNFLQNQVIPVVNNNSEAVVELQNYVKNYFDNLDVQEEINNKLDEMVESGELQNIIEEYLNTVGIIGYDTVNDLKEATNLIVGNRCKTLGFYSINDGGSATYKIVDDDTLQADDSFVIELDNGLKAILIHNDYIIAETLGFKGNDDEFDNGLLFRNIMTNNETVDHTVNLIFGNKTYRFSETLIYDNLYFNIYGKSNNLGNYERHTIFKPFNENQRYIIKIGGEAQFSIPETWNTYWKTNFNIEGITFSDDDKPLLRPAAPNQEKYGLLCIEYFSGLNLDVSFTNTYSRCIYEKNCWEINYKWLSCRACNYDVTDCAFYIDNVLADNFSNTSAHFFHFIDIETINGTFMRTGNSSKLQNIIFDNISVENGTRNNVDKLGKPIAIIETVSDYEAITNTFGLFEFNSNLHGVQFNIINLHNFGNSYYYIDDNDTKGVDILFKINGNYEINVNSINFNLCGGFQKITGTGNLDTYIESILSINSMIYSPRTLPQSSPFTSNGDLLGYFYNEITGGIIDINKTNMQIIKSINDVTLLKPQLYKGLDIKNDICLNNYGRFRFGIGDQEQICLKGQYLGEIISKKLLINFPCKINIGLKVNTVAAQGEKIVGLYYYDDENTYGGRLTANVTNDDIGKYVTKTLTVTQTILASYDIIRLIISGVTSYELYYIDIEPIYS